ncbi:MAG: ABC transporter ATP-binding protein [Methanomassiliicoccus sp.]|nr:ABC transporter ATP-binding protein [Methanomassiliicoccus sp.]
MKAIEIDHLRKAFDEREVLHDVSLQIERGDLFAFLGPNGAGKTTTMRIVLGTLEASGGRATVMGEDLATSREMRSRVGVLFERHGLYERLSVRDNLDHYARMFSLRDRRDRIDDVLEAVGLSERADDRVAALSTGLKRRAGLARALLNEPEVLFLDEPTSSLDPQAQKDFRTIITRLRESKGMTVFLNTHNLDEVQRICTRVAILDRGRILLSGTMDEVRAPGSAEAEVVLASDAEAVKAEGLFSADGRVKSVQRRGSVLQVVLSAPLSVREVVGWGLDVHEYRSSRRSLDEVYFDVLGKGAAA